MEQPNNPLHGKRLDNILKEMVEKLGWDAMAAEVNINCFKSNQTVKSSLKFLRQHQWARDKVERLYVKKVM